MGIAGKETLLYDLCKWLVKEGLADGYAENGETLVSWYCVENTFATSPNNLICVVERKSKPSYGYAINGNLQVRAVEFVVRSKTLEPAMIRTQRIYDAIERNNRQIWINDEKTRFAMIVPKNIPYKSGQDANGRNEVSLLCEICTTYDVKGKE